MTVRDLSASSDKQGIVRKVTFLGLYMNIALTAGKISLGYLGRSQAVIADGVHSLSDLITDFAVLFGVKYWSAPPDENHPYGHARIESIITLIIGFILAMVAVGIGYKAISTIRDEHLNQTLWIASIGPFLSIILKEYLYRITVSTGRKVKSSAVIANAWHHRSDALSSIPALAAVVLATINPAWSFVDHIGAIIVSIFILKVSWDIIKPAFIELTDTGADDKEKEEINKIAMNISGVEEVHDIRTRKFSSELIVDLHILVDPNISVFEGHEISEKVKKQLIAEMNIIDAIVHIEPMNEQESKTGGYK